VLPWQKRLVAYMLEVDRAEMNAEERARSIREQRALDRAIARYVLPRVIQVLLPFYDPRGQRAPRVLHHALKHFETVARQRKRLTA
jgi:hypothetical protein